VGDDDLRHVDSLRWRVAAWIADATRSERDAAQPYDQEMDSVAESAVPDVLAPGLAAIFCGINPGRASAAARAHFANPRNDLWRLLHDTGLTPRLLAPAEQFALLDYGYGLTNVALRTTRGSGDLRRGDFDGASERLERIAAELRPGWIAFVGKEAYRGAFGERAELGVQRRRLADALLFVLPSTSPANAAVPYRQRLRWFQELAGRVTGRPLRPAVRALVVDPAGRVLLVRFEWQERSFWASPGGGIDTDETDEHALVRELAEECGLRGFELGPCLWTREHWFADMPGWGGQAERHYLVRTPAFTPAPELSAEQLAAEGVVDLRWWTQQELAMADAVFAPRRLPELVRELTEHGPPPLPIDVGV
jgi:G:T/U-mismatch repair DNA glycosylase/ADP-ribose pyrophosphatase YjhB (NUDIX family)